MMSRIAEIIIFIGIIFATFGVGAYSSPAEGFIFFGCGLIFLGFVKS